MWIVDAIQGQWWKICTGWYTLRLLILAWFVFAILAWRIRFHTEKAISLAVQFVIGEDQRRRLDVGDIVAKGIAKVSRITFGVSVGANDGGITQSAGSQVKQVFFTQPLAKNVFPL